MRTIIVVSSFGLMAATATADVAPICQPVDASVVHNDPQALCHEKLKAQVRITTEQGKRVFMETCARQMRIWSGK